MRVFESSETCKLNFIDDKNVFVGFDFGQNCCESFGYKITKEEPTSFERLENTESLDSVDFPGFNFDTTYKREHDENGVDGQAVTFKVLNDAGEALFVSLMNSHNGYYSHGFDMKIGETTVFEGSL